MTSKSVQVNLDSKLGSDLGIGLKAPANLADFSWLIGAWIERKDGIETEEYWTVPGGGMMLGLGRSVRENGRTSFEYLRIEETEDGIVYYASPQGKPETLFHLKELLEFGAIFENMENDFPQRIIYRLHQDGTLSARIEGSRNVVERSMEWRWGKVEG